MHKKRILPDNTCVCVGVQFGPGLTFFLQGHKRPDCQHLHNADSSRCPEVARVSITLSFLVASGLLARQGWVGPVTLVSVIVPGRRLVIVILRHLGHQGFYGTVELRVCGSLPFPGIAIVPIVSSAVAASCSSCALQTQLTESVLLVVRERAVLLRFVKPVFKRFSSATISVLVPSFHTGNVNVQWRL